MLKVIKFVKHIKLINICNDSIPVYYVMADRKERERERALGSSYQVFRDREREFNEIMLGSH